GRYAGDCKENSNEGNAENRVPTAAGHAVLFLIAASQTDAWLAHRKVSTLGVIPASSIRTGPVFPIQARYRLLYCGYRVYATVPPCQEELSAPHGCVKVSCWRILRHRRGLETSAILRRPTLRSRCIRRYSGRDDDFDTALLGPGRTHAGVCS